VRRCVSSPCHRFAVEVVSGGFMLWLLAVGTRQGLLSVADGESMPAGD